MKTKLLFFAFFLTFAFTSVGQNNHVENLTYSQWYESPNNYFELAWQEPAQPHGELIGYNIYRNDELFRFQTETTLYNLYSDLYGYVSNCDEPFLSMDNQGQPYENGFDMHVTAVYAGEIESDYVQTEHSFGAAISTKSFTREKAVLFPNPTNGVLNIANETLEKIDLYDLSGKMIQTFAPGLQIDLSNVSKGLYIIKLFYGQKVIADKIVVD